MLVSRRNDLGKYVLLLGHVELRLLVTCSLVQRQLLFVWQDSPRKRCRKGCGAGRRGRLPPRNTLLRLWWTWSINGRCGYEESKP